MNHEKINQAFDQFDQLTALIIGDVMIDAYCWGKVDRISPEAPVPVVSVERKENRMGGAANVALNVQSLGAKPILCAVIGDDDNGKLFHQLMLDQNMETSGLVSSSERITTVKTRVLGHQQQMLRIDEEITTSISSSDVDRMVSNIQSILSDSKVDVIIFEDYDKGVITPELIEKVVTIAKAQNIPVTVDPKKDNFLDYHNVSMFKPNLKELREGLKVDIPNKSKAELDEAVQALKDKMNIESALITLSENGVYFNKSESDIIPAHIRKISDVSGAGDTVISVASLCLAQGLELSQAAHLANLAGGLVCEKVGVVPIDKEQLRNEALRLSNQ